MDADATVTLLLLVVRLYFDRAEASPFKAVTKRKIELCFLSERVVTAQMISDCVYARVCVAVCVSFFIKYLLFFYLLDFAPIRN